MRIAILDESSEERTLALYIGTELRPTLDERYCRDAGEFARLNLVEPATVDSAFTAQLVTGHTTQHLVDLGGALGLRAKQGREA